VERSSASSTTVVALACVEDSNTSLGGLASKIIVKIVPTRYTVASTCSLIFAEEDILQFDTIFKTTTMNNGVNKVMMIVFFVSRPATVPIIGYD